MPVLVRLAAFFLFRSLQRRATGARAGRRPLTPPEMRDRIGQVRGRVIEGARITGHVVTLSAFLAATGVLATAGATATSLGPRWLGVTLLGLALLAGFAAARELRFVWRLRMAQVRRRRASSLSGHRV